MQEIGEKLKEAREGMGLSLDEAAEDLKVKTTQIEAAEAGDMKAFKDVFSLKFFIRDYSKYLGLNYDEMVDEFNEYLFDYTSKLSLADIKKAEEADKKTKEKSSKITSPYTNTKKRKIMIPPLLIWILVLCILLIVGYFVYEGMDKNVSYSTNSSNVIE